MEIEGGQSSGPKKLNIVKSTEIIKIVRYAKNLIEYFNENGKKYHSSKNILLIQIS